MKVLPFTIWLAATSIMPSAAQAQYRRVGGRVPTSIPGATIPADSGIVGTFVFELLAPVTHGVLYSMGYFANDGVAARVYRLSNSEAQRHFDSTLSNGYSLPSATFHETVGRVSTQPFFITTYGEDTAGYHYDLDQRVVAGAGLVALVSSMGARGLSMPIGVGRALPSRAFRPSFDILEKRTMASATGATPVISTSELPWTAPRIQARAARLEITATSLGSDAFQANRRASWGRFVKPLVPVAYNSMGQQRKVDWVFDTFLVPKAPGGVAADIVTVDTHGGVFNGAELGVGRHLSDAQHTREFMTKNIGTPESPGALFWGGNLLFSSCNVGACVNQISDILRMFEQSSMKHHVGPMPFSVFAPVGYAFTTEAGAQVLSGTAPGQQTISESDVDWWMFMLNNGQY